MRIAFISQPFEAVTPNVQGGSIAIWMDRVIHALDASAFEFIVYASRFPNQPAQEKHGNIEYRRFSNSIDVKIAKPFRVIERLLRYPIRKRPYFATYSSYFFYASQIARDLQSQNCDIVHIFNFSQFAPIIRRYNPKVKIILHMQCEWLAELDKAWGERRLQDTDMVIGCSRFTTGRIQQRFPQHAHKCHTVYNGVDPRYFLSGKNGEDSGQSKQKNLLFVGRVSPEKAVHILLQAMRKIAAKFPDIKLNIVGPIGSAPFEYMGLISDDHKVNQIVSFYKGRLFRDNYPTYLQQLTEGLEKNVTFTGLVPHTETIQYYQTADVLINPSLTEAFGMSLVEAMASRVPIVATRVGGMTEIIEDSHTGLLVESADPEALADAIIHLLESESLRAEMGEAGPKKVTEKYSWGNIAKSLGDLYHKLSSN